MTLRSAIDQYIDRKTALGARFRSAAFALRSYARFVGDGVGCDEIRSEQAIAFLFVGSSAPSYSAYKHSVLSGFYRDAIGRGLTSRSPLPVQAPRRSPPVPPHIYSHDELHRLFDAVKTYRQRARQLEPHTFRAFLLLLYGTGLRRRPIFFLVFEGSD